MSSSRQSVAVIGGSGFIGARLVTTLAATGYDVFYTYSSRALDLPVSIPNYRVTLPLDMAILEKHLAGACPQVIVYAAVPSPQNATLELHNAVSVEGVKRTLEIMQRIVPNALFIYLSTNTVFGGGRGAYKENEQPDPLARNDPYRNYAFTKANGEQIVIQNWPNYIIARTSVVDGRDVYGKLYFRLGGQVEKLQAGQPLVRFNDRFFSPTLVDNLIEAMLEILQPNFGYRGILHLVGSPKVSDYELARYVARYLQLDESLVTPESMKNSPTMANGPRDNSLDMTFTQSILHTHLMNVEEQIEWIFK